MEVLSGAEDAGGRVRRPRGEGDGWQGKRAVHEGRADNRDFTCRPMPLPESKDPTRFILLGTSHAGNVGAAARAMKVMGFSDLVLVAPRWPDVQHHPEAHAMASG